MTVLMEGLVFGESPRWHDGRLWVSDWGAHRIVAIDPGGGGHEVVATVESFPLCFDFLPDGRLLAVDSARRLLLRREPDGSLVTHADLGPVSDKPWNDIVVDARGNAYVNSIGYDFPGGSPAPGLVALVTPRGAVRTVADGFAFPNGMAIIGGGAAGRGSGPGPGSGTGPDFGLGTARGSGTGRGSGTTGTNAAPATLIVAESHASRLTAYSIEADGGLSDRRVWAETPGDHPDGICTDAEGAVWYADVAHGHCVRVREGGEVLATVAWDRGAFACALSRGPDPRLYVVGQEWTGAPDPARRTGRVASFPAPAPGAGHP